MCEVNVVDTDLLIKESKIRASDPEYTKDQVIQILYDNLKPVSEFPYDKVLDSSKYVKIARDYNYLNYRLCLYKDILNLRLSNSLSFYHKSFISKSGAVIAIFNTLNGKPISIVFRSLSEKDFLDYSLVYGLYGYDMIDDNFRYGDYLVITEGLYDADTLRQIYPNVLATQTSNVTILQAEILKTMTDKFVIAFDADSAGDSGFEKVLSRLGTDIKRLPIYGRDKDVGVMEEMKDIPYEYNLRKEFYLKQLEECKYGIGFSL